jgi:hypothetical protein
LTKRRGGLLARPALRPREQRANDRDQSGHLDADEPREVARHLLVLDLEAAIDSIKTSLEASFDLLKPSIDLFEASIDSLFELPDRVADFDQRVAVLAHLTLQVRDPFFESGHGNLLELNAA